LNHIGKTNTDIATIIASVTQDVVNATDRQPRPWFYSSFIGSVVLNTVETMAVTTTPGPEPAKDTPVATAPADDTMVELEKFMFTMAKESGDPADFRAYLDQFPNGIFAALARNAIERATSERALANEVAPQPAPQPTSQPQVQQQFALAQPNTLQQTQPFVPQPQTAPLTRTLSVPLSLTATDRVRQQQATEYTEQLLVLNRMQRRTVQARLNAIGHNVGSTDGNFGPRTREGISKWQARTGLIPTGYLNMAQLELLTANSEAAFRSYVVANPLVSQGSGTYRARNRTDVGAVLGAVAGAVILKKILD